MKFCQKVYVVFFWLNCKSELFSTAIVKRNITKKSIKCRQLQEATLQTKYIYICKVSLLLVSKQRNTNDDDNGKQASVRTNEKKV